MPGSMFELECPGCGRVHSLHTGASYCLAHGKEWEFEQWVCAACQTIVSWANMTCSCQSGKVCDECGGQLQRWEGRVWHERTAEGMVGAERVEGPCPSCGVTVTQADSNGFQGLWD